MAPATKTIALAVAANSSSTEVCCTPSSRNEKTSGSTNSQAHSVAMAIEKNPAAVPQKSVAAMTAGNNEMNCAPGTVDPKATCRIVAAATSPAASRYAFSVPGWKCRGLKYSRLKSPGLIVPVITGLALRDVHIRFAAPPIASVAFRDKITLL